MKCPHLGPSRQQAGTFPAPQYALALFVPLLEHAPETEVRLRVLRFAVLAIVAAMAARSLGMTARSASGARSW